jgi:putative endonuclease
MDCFATLAMTGVSRTSGEKPMKPKRAYEHREGLVKGFSAKYDCKVLVWYEAHETMIEAINREKQIKGGSRAKKLALIEALNPEWNDLYDTLI